MKRYIVTLALVVALTSFVGNAKGAITFQNIGQNYGTSGTLSFAYLNGNSQIQVSTSSVLQNGYTFSYTAGTPGGYSSMMNMYFPDQPAYWTLNFSQRYPQVDQSYTYVASNPLLAGSDVRPQMTNGSGYISSSGYLGLGFDIIQNSRLAGSYFGWAYIAVNGSIATLEAVAFNSTMNQSIHVGDTGNGSYVPSSVPEPSALSLLAFGLGGLAMMRRRRP
jgi:hypothetical protein